MTRLTYDHADMKYAVVGEGAAQRCSRGALAVVEAYPLGYAATTQRAVLQSVAADVTTAYMTAGQEDDLSLETHRDKTRVSPLDECEYVCTKVLYYLFLELLKSDHLHVKSLDL